MPTALNARIPNATLDRLLTGDLISKCYTCSAYIDENNPDDPISGCVSENCPNHACWLLATRNSSGSANRWRFRAGCLGSREAAEVDMSIMYYIRSQTTVIYQLRATCLTDNCNNFTTFQLLKADLTVVPDLTCFITSSNSSTIGPTTSPTETGSSILSTSLGQTTIIPTTTPSSAQSLFLARHSFLVYYLIVFF